MINPMDPLFPIHEIELHHVQTRYVTRLGGNLVKIQDLNLREANHYILKLLNTSQYRLVAQIIIKIRMNSDRVELRMPITNGNALVYRDKPIEQLLLQWLLFGWTSLSKRTIIEILELNVTFTSDKTYSDISKLPASSVRPFKKSSIDQALPWKSII